ncbi:MAG: response regulator [Candidatus Marsarchaeota archaeon]|jgi:DNA-binding response OmpR family regulator|nr:response regulator [Candidatus Marsarchaeota archaeon]
MEENLNKIKSELLSVISDRQQISLNELKDIYFSRGVGNDKLENTLQTLEKENLVASRINGGVLTYYILENEPFRNVLIVEDDKNINKLMALSLGKDFEIDQIYDGGEAIGFIRKKRPNLVILDLMLPHKDGLDICRTIKSDPELNNTVVILVSAMDPASNRFKGIKYGADYYIKKPFDPKELRTLVNIFLRKKGKRFDPLIDLPDEERLSKELERSIKESNEYTIGTLKIENLGTYARKFGEKPAVVILRVVSQLLQDDIKKYGQDIFLGFLNSDEFVIAGKKDALSNIVGEIKREFEDVLQFILQDAGYKPVIMDIESIFESEDIPKLAIVFTESEKNERIAKREEVLKKKMAKDNISMYTYEELQNILGSSNLDIIITRDEKGINLRIGNE